MHLGERQPVALRYVPPCPGRPCIAPVSAALNHADKWMLHLRPPAARPRHPLRLARRRPRPPATRRRSSAQSRPLRGRTNPIWTDGAGHDVADCRNFRESLSARSGGRGKRSCRVSPMPDSPATKTRSVSVLIGILAALSVPAIVVAVLAINKGSQDLKKIHRLEAQVHVLAAASGGATASVGSRVTSLESKLSALEATSTTNTAKQSKTEGGLHQLVLCIPELQSELSGLEIKGETYAASYIRNGTNVSRDCTNTLYGNG